MVNIIDIINNVNDNSLVLLDELGGGTDPIEGAALARAIISHLHNNGVKTVATTHYAELKSYALDTQGVENACFEFDVNSLKPTYRLFVGIPGKSNAFEIAASLGMDEDIINKAKSGLSEENMRFDRIAEALENARVEAENERNETRRLRLALAEEKKKIDSHLAEIEKKKELIIAKSREDAARILDKARFETNQLLNSLEDIKKDINSQNAAESVSAAKSFAKKGIANIENIVDPVDEKDNEEYKLPRLPVINDVVLIVSLNKKADVTRVDEKNNRVYVSSGNINMWVNFKDIRLTNGKNADKSNKTRKVSGLKNRSERSVSGEIDIRGMNIEEGIMEVDRYIDSSILAGIETITVIHGKGTGVLRNGIHSYLRKHKNVDGFRVGTFGEGENGVTIVTLKS
jgi:DNA mismatch repair protein MutS2